MAKKVFDTPESLEMYKALYAQGRIGRVDRLSEEGVWAHNLYTKIAYEEVDPSADEATKVKQAQRAADRVRSEFIKRGYVWSCATIAGASETAFVVGGVQFENIGSFRLKNASPEAYYAYYGENGIGSDHVANFVWVDGQKYYYDGQFYPIRGLLKWEWD